jgi:hypothetical protein
VKEYDVGDEIYIYVKYFSRIYYRVDLSISNEINTLQTQCKKKENDSPIACPN